MRTIEKSVRIAHAQGKNWKTELYRSLLDYRTTPHVTTGMAPADLLFDRQIRNRLPDRNAMISDGKGRKQEGKNEDSQPDESSPTSSREAILERDARENNKIKGRADERNRARKSTICASEI